jgi:hypothetical protein
MVLQVVAELIDAQQSHEVAHVMPLATKMVNTMETGIAQAAMAYTQRILLHAHVTLTAMIIADVKDAIDVMTMIAVNVTIHATSRRRDVKAVIIHVTWKQEDAHVIQHATKK